MNNEKIFSVCIKVASIFLMLVLIVSLQTEGLIIDLLLLGIYYETITYLRDLAKDAEYDDSDLKLRIEELEKKIK